AATCDRPHRACARCSRRARYSAPSSKGDLQFGSAWKFSVHDAARHDTAQRVIQAGVVQPTTQVSLVPPPCEELTISEPAVMATRVRPHGTMRISLPPDSTKGRRSMWRGAMPASTKVGQVDSDNVGWAMYFSGAARMRRR